MNKIIKNIKYAGLFTIMFICTILIVTSILYFVKISITPVHIIASFIINTIVYLLIAKKLSLDIKTKIKSIVVALLVIVLSIAISGYIYDVSWDGNAYHKDAVGALKNGWNPVYEDSTSFAETNNYLPTQDKTIHSIWKDHYTKGYWMVAANIYSLTGNIETGKAFVLLVMFCCFAFISHYLDSKLKNPWISLFISCIVIITPVSLVQMFTYYNDGILATLFYAIIAALIMLKDKRCDTLELEKWIWLGSFIIVISNVKFTGLAFAGIFCLAFYLLWLYEAYKNKEIKSFFVKTTGIFFLIVVISTCIVGYSSYCKNFIEHGHALYPLAGDNKVDIMTENQPTSFATRTTRDKLFRSVFSYTANYYKGKGEPELKKLFETNIYEKAELQSIDIRIGGYGVFFGGILCISIIIIFISGVIIFKDRNWPLFINLFIVLGVSIGLLLALTDSWWARYSPQLYIFPLSAIILISLYLKSRKEKLNIFFKSMIRGIALIFTTIIIINLLYFVRYNVIPNLMISVKSNNNIQNLKDKDGVIILVKNKAYTGILNNLEDSKIKYKLSYTSDKSYKNLYSSYLEYKLEGKK